MISLIACLFGCVCRWRYQREVTPCLRWDSVIVTRDVITTLNSSTQPFYALKPLSAHASLTVSRKPILRSILTLYYCPTVLAGRITGLARPSVRPSVCLSVPYGRRNSKTKCRRETKIDVIVPPGRSNWMVCQCLVKRTTKELHASLVWQPSECSLLYLGLTLTLTLTVSIWLSLFVFSVLRK